MPGLQPVLVRVGGGARPGRNAELREDVAHVPRHGLFADEELGGNGAVRLARSDKANHLGLQNAEVALEELRAARIQVLASDLGGTRGRRVVVHTADGSAWVKEL